jgi:hypothetical protein
MKEFAQARDAKQTKISGYAKRIRDDSFLLLPTLYTPQISLLCVVASGNLPPDNAFVSVEGSTEWANLRRSHGRQFEGDKVISVQSWNQVAPEYEVPKPKMGFRQFKTDAFGRILNLEPIVQDLVAYQMVSCPDFGGFLGGLNISLYDKTGRNTARMVAREIEMIVPKDMGKPHILSTPLGEVEMRYKFNFVRVDADERLPSGISKVMIDRSADAAFSELSISLSSSKSRPKNLEEPPCALADFPTILNEDVDLAAVKVDPSLDAFKYMLYQHLAAPMVEDSAAIIRNLSEKLVELPQRFDIPADKLARFKILDASYVGRPQSILRLALATCRAGDRHIVSNDDVINAYNNYFLKNFDHVYDSWSDSDLFEEKGIPIPRLSRDEWKILRIVEKYESTGRAYATYNEIAEESKIGEYALGQFLFDLTQTKSRLIEIPQKCYRTIPRDATVHDK